LPLLADGRGMVGSTGRMLKGGGGRKMDGRSVWFQVKDQMKRSCKIKIFGLARERMDLISRGRFYCVHR
jgi:hypothetical protein